MVIKTSHTKDIRFKVSERIKAALFVKMLLKEGWDLHVGEVINTMAFGDLCIKEFWIDGEVTEELQLHKLELKLEKLKK